MKTLKIALKQFAPSVIVMKRLHKETKLADMQYLWEIYLPAMHAKRYQSWTKLLLQKVHLVKWTCNRYVMLQLFLNTFMLTEVAILNLTFFLCLICVHKFYPSKFFSGCKKVCLVTCSTVYLCKEIQGIWCFRVDVKTPFAKLSIFFFLMITCPQKILRIVLNSFVEPNYVREVSRKSIWCLGSKIWNGIEKNIKTCTSTNSFKHALKKQFLKN